MTLAQYAARLLTDTNESNALDIATGRYAYLKDIIPELHAEGLASLSLAMALERVSNSFVPQQMLITSLVSGDSALVANRFVQANSGVADSVVMAATAGQRGILGVCLATPALGAACTIAGGGVCQVLSGVAVTKGAAVISDASGQAITATAGVGNHVYGYALEAASAAGVLIKIAFGYAGPVTNAS